MKIVKIFTLAVLGKLALSAWATGTVSLYRKTSTIDPKTGKEINDEVLISKSQIGKGHTIGEFNPTHRIINLVVKGVFNDITLVAVKTEQAQSVREFLESDDIEELKLTTLGDNKFTWVTDRTFDGGDAYFMDSLVTLNPTKYPTAKKMMPILDALKLVADTTKIQGEAVLSERGVAKDHIADKK